jgi:hypothetical protein
MAGQRRIFRSAKAIAGTVLVLLGTFILYENLAGAVAELSHSLENGSQAVGVLPAVVLAASQPAHAYAVDHHRFLEGLIQQALASSWPLLLVAFGSVLSRGVFKDKPKRIVDTTAQSVDLLPLCPTFRFAKSRAAGVRG